MNIRSLHLRKPDWHYIWSEAYQMHNQVRSHDDIEHAHSWLPPATPPTGFFVERLPKGATLEKCGVCYSYRWRVLEVKKP